MIEAKHIIFFVGSAVCVPGGIIAAMNSRKIHDLVFIALVCSFFLVNKPEEIGQYPDGLSPDEVEADQDQTGGGVRTYRTAQTWEVKQVFWTPIIYFIAIAIIGHLMPLFLITSHGILHFTDMGFSQMQAASILSLIMGSAPFNLSHPPWGGPYIL